MNSFKNRKAKLLSYSFYIILIDQLSKLLVSNTLVFEGTVNIIPNVLNFTLVKNKGAAFSILSNSTTILTITSILASLLLITYILRFPQKSYWNSIGFTYLLGGTIGNGTDRLLKGYVIDFIDLVPIDFPIFNLADVSINIAIICFMIDIIRTKKNTAKALNK